MVISLVKVLEYSGEDFRLLGWKVDALARGFEELGPTSLSEVGGFREDVFVGGEKALGRADGDGDDG
jgi:hypothetical protein